MRNLLQPRFVNDAVYQGEVAATAGEIKKDERHQDRVESNGCLFYPLVVESLGTWSSSSIETLKIIARKSTFMTGRTLSKAISNLHEQLSVRLWQCNSRMIMDRLNLLELTLISGIGCKKYNIL